MCCVLCVCGVCVSLNKTMCVLISFRKKLWYLKLIDSVLNMETINNTVFFALAEGSLAIIKVCV